MNFTSALVRVHRLDNSLASHVSFRRADAAGPGEAVPMKRPTTGKPTRPGTQQRCQRWEPRQHWPQRASCAQRRRAARRLPGTAAPGGREIARGATAHSGGVGTSHRRGAAFSRRQTTRMADMRDTAPPAHARQPAFGHRRRCSSRRALRLAFGPPWHRQRIGAQFPALARGGARSHRQRPQAATGSCRRSDEWLSRPSGGAANRDASVSGASRPWAESAGRALAPLPAGFPLALFTERPFGFL